MVFRSSLVFRNFKYFLNRWKQVLLITFLIRFWLLLYSIYLNPNAENFLYPWVRWDGPHYIDIARNWYVNAGEPALFIVFYPLYPILIKLANFLINDFSVSAVLVSIFFSFTASVALYELCLLDFKKNVAFLAVWFLNIFPTSFFLQAGYTESLFLTSSILSVYFFRKQAFLLSGLAGGFSTMTRFNGLLLIPTLLLEVKSIGKNIIGLLLIPFGFLIYLLINFLTFGDFFYFTKPLSEHWFKKLSWPWVGIDNLVHSLPNMTDPSFYIYFSEIAAIIFLTLITMFVFLRTKFSYGTYMLLNLLLITSTSFILSTPRYALSLFPIFIALGTIKNRLIIVALSLVSTVLLIYLTTQYTQGMWAS